MRIDSLRPQLSSYIAFLITSFQDAHGNPTVDFTGGKLVAATILSKCHADAKLQGSESPDLNTLVRDIRDILLLFQNDAIEWTLDEFGTFEPRLSAQQQADMNQWTVYQIDSVLQSIYSTLRKYCEPYPTRPRQDDGLSEIGTGT